MEIIQASASHLEKTMQAVSVCVVKLRSLGIDQWDEEYPSETTVGAAIDSKSLYLIEAPGSIAAAAALDTNQPPQYHSCQWHSCEPALVVHHLMVHPDYWRMGYASRLMDFAEAHAESMGFRSIRLDAYTGNPAALSLYRTRGYSEAGKVVFPRKGLRFICFEKAVQHSAT